MRLIGAGWRTGFVGACLAYFAALSAGMNAPNLSPLLVSGLQASRDLSPAAAGLILSVELLTAAFTAIVLAAHLSKWNLRATAIIGCLLAVAAHAASSIAPGILMLAALRFLAGLGEALCICVSNAVLAKQREPDRVYATAAVLMALGNSVFFSLAPYVSDRTHGWGVFALQAGLTAVVLPLLLLLPRASAAEAAAARQGMAPGFLPLTVAILLFMSFSCGLYAFAASIAYSAGVGPAQLPVMLTVSGIIALLSTGTVSVVASRFGRVLPLAIGLGSISIASLIFLETRAPMVAMAMYVVIQSAFAFIVPFLFGLCSALDPTGRLATTASSVTLFGAALSPAAAGFVFERFGYPAVGWTFPPSHLVIFLLIWWLTGRRPGVRSPVSAHSFASE